MLIPFPATYFLEYKPPEFETIALSPAVSKITVPVKLPDETVKSIDVESVCPVI